MTWHNNKIHQTILETSRIVLDQLEENKTHALGLTQGQAGIALYLSYLSRYLKDEQYLDIVYDIYNTLFEAFNEQEMIPTLADGIAGIAWSFSHLNKNDFFNQEEIDMQEIDDFVYKASLQSLKSGNYDLLHGGIGGGVYLLSRLPNEKIEQYLKDLLEELAANAITDEFGFIKWEDKFNRFHDTLPTFNLGLAHGMPSIILFLAKLYKLGISEKKCLELIQGNVSWMLDKRYNETKLSAFPLVYVGDTPSYQPSRLAWCYGDLGIAYAILHAGRITNNQEWYQEAIRIALLTTKQHSLEDALIRDACFCHGTVGVAHFYKRFYEITGENEFKEATLRWRNETLNHKHINKSPIVFPNYKPTKDEYEADFGLLTGLSGVGLSLIYLNSDMDPHWDQCFLIC